ncbi:MAG: class I SAM-dependent methyltransferase, partial [Chloroflexota bacterium]
MNKTYNWASGDLYEPYVGRWSRLVAQEFLKWLDIPVNSQWLDVGCGTGALSQTILTVCNPQKVKGVDRSEGYVAYVRSKVNDPRAEFEVGDAQTIPVESNSFDAAVSGLVLNFVSQPEKMVAEMMRAVTQGGTVALYVWDYADKMELMRYFWDAAQAVNPAAHDLDEARRFSICNPDSLSELFQKAGLKQVETRPLDVTTHFKDFDDYWNPFLGGQGPAAGYAMSLSEEKRIQLRERIRASLPFAADGSIPLIARAWGVKG